MSRYEFEEIAAKRLAPGDRFRFYRECPQHWNAPFEVVHVFEKHVLVTVLDRERRGALAVYPIDTMVWVRRKA